MRALFVAALLSLSSSIWGTSLDQLNFSLPSNTSNWGVLNELKSDKGEVRIYGPPQESAFDSLEIFGVSANNHPNSRLDIESLKESIAALFPGLQLEAKVLESDPHSVLFEWKVIEDKEVRLYGLSRVLTNEQGTALLSYQTEKPDQFAAAQTIWMPVLKKVEYKIAEKEVKPALPKAETVPSANPQPQEALPKS